MNLCNFEINKSFNDNLILIDLQIYSVQKRYILPKFCLIKVVICKLIKSSINKIIINMKNKFLHDLKN